jgi:predicted ATPase
VGAANVNLETGEVLVDGRSTQLGRRALKVFVVLWEGAGGLVTKDRLISEAWSGEAAKENALQAQISGIRRALGRSRGALETVPARGYRLRLTEVPTLAVSLPGARRPDSEDLVREPRKRIPGLTDALLGRSEDLAKLKQLLFAKRLVTIVGVGGIGKTSLAGALVGQVHPDFVASIAIVELAPLRQSGLLSSAVAVALGLRAPPGKDSFATLIECFGAHRWILVLDNCEHLIDEASQFAHAALKSCPELRILATSRESLRVDGESIYLLAPLKVPPEGSLDKSVRDFSAVELFISRTSALEGAIEWTATNIGLAVQIARELDGLPLAIELAAARAQTLGLANVAANLQRLSILSAGKRSADPRQQTLKATFDWSFHLLSSPEQEVFLILSVFPDTFSAEDVVELAASDSLPSWNIEDALASLISKSLVAPVSDARPERYRLLQALRAYAEARLSRSPLYRPVMCSLARACLAFCERARLRLGTPDAIRKAGLANTRRALEWTHSTTGDAALSVRLVVDSMPLFFEQGMMAESLLWLDKAIATSETSIALEPLTELKLLAQLGIARQYTSGWNASTAAVWGRVLDLADAAGSDEFRQRGCWGLWGASCAFGQHAEGLEYARRISQLEERNLREGEIRVGDRLVGTSLHLLGEHTNSWPFILKMLGQADAVDSGLFAQAPYYEYDQLAATYAIGARIRWLMGRPNEAIGLVKKGISRCQKIQHPVSSCHVLASGACPVSILVGDVKGAAEYIDRLIDPAVSGGVRVWAAVGRAWKGVLGVKVGFLNEGIEILEESIRDLSRNQFLLYQVQFRAALAEALTKAGRLDEAQAVLDEAIEESRETDGTWWLPELMRVRGEHMALKWSNRVDEAEKIYREALAVAQAGGAKGWQLRLTMSLARLWSDTGREGDALRLLEGEYQSFREGLETDDLVAAAALIRKLSRK